MLERLQIKNFQKHHQLRLVFAAPGVTTITGDNDRGKSAIIRALRWVCHNRPTSERIRRRDETNTHTNEDTVVTLWVDGHKLVRRRGNNANEYELDGQLFKALGRDVPEPIANLLNLGPDNTQGQLEEIFWFGDTAATVSEHLNAVVNLSIMDEVLGELRGRVRRLKAETDVADRSLALAQETKTAYGYVDSLAEDLAVVVKAHERWEASAASHARLVATHAAAHRWAQRAAALRACARAGAALVSLAATAGKAAQRAAALRTVVNTPPPKPLPKAKLDNLWMKQVQCAELRARVILLKSSIQKINIAFGATCTASEKQSDAEEQLAIQTKGEVCPLCQTPFQSHS